MQGLKEEGGYINELGVTVRNRAKTKLIKRNE